MAVPNTNTFSLQDVANELNADNPGQVNSLSANLTNGRGAFTFAIATYPNGFDPNHYDGQEPFSLLEFQNFDRTRVPVTFSLGGVGDLTWASNTSLTWRATVAANVSSRLFYIDIIPSDGTSSTAGKTASASVTYVGTQSGWITLRNQNGDIAASFYDNDECQIWATQNYYDEFGDGRNFAPPRQAYVTFQHASSTRIGYIDQDGGIDYYSGGGNNP